MIDFLVKSASGARAAIALAALGIGGSLLFRRSPYESLKGLLDGASLPEETITTPDRLAEVLEALGAAGRESYLQFQVWDVLNPVLMGAAGAMLLGWLLKRSRRATSAWRFVVVLPVVLLAADLLENLVIAIAIGAFPDRAVLGSVLPLVTVTKFGAAACTALAVVVMALMWLRNRLSGVPRPAG